MAKIGRPRKPDIELRKNSVKLTFTDSEMGIIEDLSDRDGRNRADYLRRLIIAEIIERKTISEFKGAIHG